MHVVNSRSPCNLYIFYSALEQFYLQNNMKAITFYLLAVLVVLVVAVVNGSDDNSMRPSDENEESRLPNSIWRRKPPVVRPPGLPRIPRPPPPRGVKPPGLPRIPRPPPPRRSVKPPGLPKPKRPIRSPKA